MMRLGDYYTGSNDDPTRCRICGREVSETELWDRFGEEQYPADVAHDACEKRMTTAKLTPAQRRALEALVNCDESYYSGKYAKWRFIREGEVLAFVADSTVRALAGAGYIASAGMEPGRMRVFLTNAGRAALERASK